ncbi:MAG: hypothetical protein V4726_18255 [Verrucomicrobiota bacterium]
MATLQFAYAGPDAAQLPDGLAEALPNLEWEVSVRKLEGIQEITPAPDFIWVDLGESPERSSSHTVLKNLAQLQKTEGAHPFLLISGSALAEKEHHALAEDIYTMLSHPAEIVTDLGGRPDFTSALAKFRAMRRKGADPKPRKAFVSVPRAPLPNADLRSGRGKLSIKLIAELYGMDVSEIGRLIGRHHKAALSKTPDAEALQKLLEPFADIALLRAPGFRAGAFRKWLHSRNEHLENRSPMDWIRGGRAADVAGFVYGILTGQPS